MSIYMPCPAAHPQALDSGTLGAFLSKIGSQPQILSAYSVKARIRNRPLMEQAAAQLLRAKVCVRVRARKGGATHSSRSCCLLGLRVECRVCRVSCVV